MVHGAVFAAIANLFTMSFEIKMAAGMNFAQIRDLNPADGWTPFKKDSEHKKNVEQKSGVLSSSLVQMQGDLSLFFPNKPVAKWFEQRFQSNTSSHWKVLFLKCIFKCTIKSTPLKINGGSTCPTMEVCFRWFSFLFMGDGCRFQPLIFQGVPSNFQSNQCPQIANAAPIKATDAQKRSVSLGFSKILDVSFLGGYPGT